MNESHKTAIGRRTMSAPARAIKEKGWVFGRVLDFGCGRGRDAAELRCEKFDPFWAPDMPDGFFDTILCTYVLNVIPEDLEAGVLAEIEAKLAPGGAAFISVRRDRETVSVTQRRVELDLPEVLSRSGAFVTYRLSLRGKKVLKS